MGNAALEREKKRKIGEGTEEEETSKGGGGSRAFVCVAPFALSFGFIHSSFLVASRSFVLWWPARASSRKRVERRRRRVEGTVEGSGSA